MFIARPHAKCEVENPPLSIACRIPSNEWVVGSTHALGCRKPGNQTQRIEYARQRHQQIGEAPRHGLELGGAAKDRASDYNADREREQSQVQD